jgi:ribosome-associated translation inhibitor RaiA
MNAQEPVELDIEFYSEIKSLENELWPEAEKRLRELAKGHRDMTGASIAIEEPAANRETPYIYRARVVVYIRPENIAGEEKADTPQAALKGALDAVTRQVREKRRKQRTKWKQPGNGQQYENRI